NLTLRGLTLTGGDAVADGGTSGGGVAYGTGTSGTLDHVTITGNMANQGGGIFNLGVLTITGSTISGNSASGGGGGIRNGGTLTIEQSTVSGNTTTSGYSIGGGIYNIGGSASVTLTNSTVS